MPDGRGRQKAVRRQSWPGVSLRHTRMEPGRWSDKPRFQRYLNLLGSGPHKPTWLKTLASQYLQGFPISMGQANNAQWHPVCHKRKGLPFAWQRLEVNQEQRGGNCRFT